MPIPFAHRAPWWLPGGNLQTIWPALYSRPHLHTLPAYRRERWQAPDGDFIDVDHLDGAPGAPALVLFHGLESSSTSRYAVAFAQVAQSLGWHFCVPHFRGCSGELNLAPRAYHSGDFEEIGWLLGRLRALHGRPLLAAGVSLGGNALLRWAEEAGDSAAHTALAVAAVSSPLDLAAAGRAIDTGFNWLVYSRMFLRTMKPARWPSWPSTRACSTATSCWPRARCTTSTTSSPRRCTASATRPITGPAHRPSRTCTASACRPWC